MKQMKCEILSAMALLFVTFTCIGCGKPVVEAGRWTDGVMNAVFIFYHMKKDLPETELREKLKAVATTESQKHDFVIQVVVHDGEYAKKLCSGESQKKIMNNLLLVGTDLINDPSAKAKGGVVYTYYKNGDYDEWFYVPKH